MRPPAALLVFVLVRQTHCHRTLLWWSNLSQKAAVEFAPARSLAHEAVTPAALAAFRASNNSASPFSMCQTGSIVPRSCGNVLYMVRHILGWFAMAGALQGVVSVAVVLPPLLDNSDLSPRLVLSSTCVE